jgi:hypothetical protein
MGAHVTIMIHKPSTTNNHTFLYKHPIAENYKRLTTTPDMLS